MTRPSQIRAALFDFDGTLCDTESKNMELARSILLEMGVPVTDEDIQELAGEDDAVIVPRYFEKYGAPYVYDDYEAIRNGCFPRQTWRSSRAHASSWRPCAPMA